MRETQGQHKNISNLILIFSFICHLKCSIITKKKSKTTGNQKHFIVKHRFRIADDRLHTSCERLCTADDRFRTEDDWLHTEDDRLHTSDD